MSAPVLWQFRASHFNEKARWALDWKGVRTNGVRCCRARTCRVSCAHRADAVPVLQLDGAGDRRLDADHRRARSAASRPAALSRRPGRAPARARAGGLLRRGDRRPHIRRAFFFDALEHTDYMVGLFASGEPAITRSAYRTFFPLARMLMRTAMGIDAPRTERSREKVEEALDRLEAEIGPSGYLVGDAVHRGRSHRGGAARAPADAAAVPVSFPEAARFGGATASGLRVAAGLRVGGRDVPAASRRRPPRSRRDHTPWACASRSTGCSIRTGSRRASAPARICRRQPGFAAATTCAPLAATLPSLRSSRRRAIAGSVRL